MGRSTDEVPILISIGYGVPRSTGRHTNIHTKRVNGVRRKKMADMDSSRSEHALPPQAPQSGLPHRQPQPPASPAEGDRGSKRQRTGPIGAAYNTLMNAISPPKTREIDEEIDSSS